MKSHVVALVLLSFATPQRAADPAAGIPISIEPHGAAGQRVRWASVAGSKYVVQTSVAFGVWTDVDVVSATSGMTMWVDPFPRPGTENFYRVTLPQREVTSIEPAVVSTTAPTTLYFLGQCFDGTELLEIDGAASGLTLTLESPQRLSVTAPPLTLGLHTFELTDSLGNPIGGGLFNLPANPQGIRIELPPTTPRMCSPADLYASALRGKLQGAGVMTAEPWVWLPRWPAPTPAGEVYYSVCDLVVPGVGLDFDWTRTFRSRLGEDTPMGVNWTHSYDIRARKDSATSVTVFDGAGRADVFRADGAGVFSCPERFETGALSGACTVFTLTFPDLGKWEFGAFGALPGPANLARISAIRDRNANALTFAYDPPTGRLTTITDTLARNYTLGYAGGRIATLTDFSGRVVTYTHNAAGDLIGVRSPAVVGTPNGNDFPAGKTTAYAYSNGTGDPQRDHNLLSVTDGLGQTPLVFTYDAEPNPANLGYDRVVRVQHGSAGQEIVFSYARLTPSPANRFSVVKIYENDRLGHLTEYEYDSLNRPVRVREYTGVCIASTAVTAGANRPGAPLRAGDPAFFETLYDWNADSLCTKVTMPRGNTHEWFYERDLRAAGSVPVEKRARLLLHRQRAEVFGVYDQDEIVERFVHDDRFGAGRGVSFPTVVMDGRGLATLLTTSSYDGVGNRTQLVHPTGRAVNFTHDVLNRVLTVHDGAPVAQFFYVGPDRLARVLNGNGTQTDFAWDGVNGVANAPGDFGWRKIVRTTHVHVPSATVIDDRVFTWDRNGNKTSRNDIRPGGPQQLHQYNYDRGDRLVFTQVSSPGLGVIRQTNYALDGANNRQNVNGPGTPNPGPYTLNTGPPTFDFEQNQYTNTPIGPHQYNANGEVTNIAGAQVFRDYAGRVVGYVPPASPPLAVYDYDARGRRVLRVLNPTGTAQTTRFGFAGAQVVSEIPGVGAPRDYITPPSGFGEEVDRWNAFATRGAVNTWLHHDDLGNTMALTDAAGAATERIEYQDYGVPMFFNGAGAPLGASPNGNAWLFCGMYYDTETGLYDSPTPSTSEIDWMSFPIGSAQKPEAPKPGPDPSNFQKMKPKTTPDLYRGLGASSGGGGFWGRIRKAFEDAKKFDPRTGRNLEVGIESVAARPARQRSRRDREQSLERQQQQLPEDRSALRAAAVGAPSCLPSRLASSPGNGCFTAVRSVTISKA